MSLNPVSNAMQLTSELMELRGRPGKVSQPKKKFLTAFRQGLPHMAVVGAASNTPSQKINKEPPPPSTGEDAAPSS